MIKRDKRPVTSSLFGVVAIQGTLLIFALSIAIENNLVVRLFTLCTIVFLLAAIYSFKNPILASIIASTFYGSLLLLQMAIGFRVFLSGGILFKVFIVILLIYSLISANRLKDKESLKEETKQ